MMTDHPIEVQYRCKECQKSITKPTVHSRSRQGHYLTIVRIYKIYVYGMKTKI